MPKQELTTKTAKELKLMKEDGMFKNTEGVRIIIDSKNELKENIDLAITRDGKFKIKCDCGFCEFTRQMIDEIEQVERE